MSIIDLNMVGILLSDLNKELNYKISEIEPCLYDEDGGDYLQFNTDGNNHIISFLGGVLWCSIQEKNLENMPVEVEMSLNERDKFETHIRLLINDKIRFLKNLEM